MTTLDRMDSMRLLAGWLEDQHTEIKDAPLEAFRLPAGWKPEDEDQHAQLIFNDCIRRCEACNVWFKPPGHALGRRMCLKHHFGCDGGDE